MRGRVARPRGYADFGRVLQASEAASPVDALNAVSRELGLLFGARAVSFLIADLSGRALVRLAHVSLEPSATTDGHGPLNEGERRAIEESATTLPFDEGPFEQALRTQQVQVVTPEDAGTAGWRADWWQVVAPVTARGETIGVLELRLPEVPDAATTADIARIGHLLAFIVIANRRHTDLFEWGQRTRSFSLSAEIQQRLLPDARTCEASSFTVSGWLEPAASIGGDTFDYVLDRDVLHLSLTDAMGHGVGAALTATVCTASLRNSRRQGATLRDQVDEANVAVADHATSREGDDFLTGLVGRLNLGTGSLDVVNAGHVAPYLARGNEVTKIELPADLPLGMFQDTRYASSNLILEAGDRLVLVTDGMLERNVASVDLPGAIAASRMLHPREAVRWLADSALDAAGNALADDATVLCLDWHGGHEAERPLGPGADPDQASGPL
jgi:serine phosphatase RsbU (regulator of sigma subunit)